MQMTEKEKDIVYRLEKHIASKGVSNDCLVQIIEVAGSFLNLQTRSDYARNNQISYNGVKNHRNNISLFGVHFIIDND